MNMTFVIFTAFGRFKEPQPVWDKEPHAFTVKVNLVKLPFCVKGFRVPLEGNRQSRIVF